MSPLIHTLCFLRYPSSCRSLASLFGVSFFLAIATFKQHAGFSYSNPIALWPLICTVISQLILVFRTLEDRWPVRDIMFGTSLFAVV